MRGVNDEVFLLLICFFTGNEKECSEARLTVLTVLLVYLFSSPYSPVVSMLVDKGRRGIGQQGIVRGRGGCFPVLMNCLQIWSSFRNLYLMNCFTNPCP